MPALRAVEAQSFIVDHGVAAPPADDILLVSALVPKHIRDIPIRGNEAFCETGA